jgi:hypothetical protein
MSEKAITTSWQVYFKDDSDKRLISAVRSLHQCIFGENFCYSMRDLREYEATIVELERRGYTVTTDENIAVRKKDDEEIEEYVEKRSEMIQRIIGAVKENPGRYSELIENMVPKYFSNYEPEDMEKMFPEIFKEAE